jgi:hypothetical protein
MDAPQFRKCLNIKSRKHSDVQCTLVATQGDFCQRHYKRPIRFFDRTKNDQRIIYTRSQTTSALRIQKWWKQKIQHLHWRRQGPLFYTRELAQNSVELYSMEPLTTIPTVFFFSYADAQKNCWAFDIRSLVTLFSQGQLLQNPYTREVLPEATFIVFRKRMEWLRKRKYPVLYNPEENLTPEQEWNQRVLDVFMKIESMGYLLSTQWFHDLTARGQKTFYRNLFQLWTWRLGLSTAEKEEICPGHSLTTTRLFRHVPDDSPRVYQDVFWWRKKNLFIIHTLVTRGASKSLRALGALYVLMALVQVSEPAAEAYPWVLESVTSE